MIFQLFHHHHYHHCYQLLHPQPGPWCWQVLGWSGCWACSASNFRILSHVLNTNKFLANLVVVVLSIKLNGLANLLKLWMNVDRNPAQPRRTCISFIDFSSSLFFTTSILLSFICFLFLNALKFDISEDPVAQIPLFLTRNYYRGWAILSFPTSSSLFCVIEFFDTLIWLTLDLGVVVQLFYLINLSNNRVPPPTTSLFSAISADNGKLSDDLIGHALGLGVRDVAINQPIAHQHLQPYCPQLYPLTITSFLTILLRAFWAKECVVEIGGSYLSLRWKIDHNQ